MIGRHAIRILSLGGLMASWNLHARGARARERPPKTYSPWIKRSPWHEPTIAREQACQGSKSTSSGEGLAEAKTSYFPRLDTYLLASELLTPLDFRIKAGSN